MDIVSSQRELFFANYLSAQNWSLPTSIIYYLAKNPSCMKVYIKLVKSCKYFFVTNSILIVSRLHAISDNKWKFLFNENEIDLHAVNCKIWLIDGLHVYKSKNAKECIGSFIVPKIYECALKELTFVNHNIYFNDFIVLVEKCYVFDMKDSNVINNVNGVNLCVEKIILCLPFIKYFSVTFSIGVSNFVNSNSVEELIKIPHFRNVNFFQLNSIPQCFDVVTFFLYIKKVKRLRASLDFDSNICEEFRKSLEVIVSKILDDEISRIYGVDYLMPYIFFPGFDGLSCFSDFNIMYYLNCMAFEN